ncbi:hypothetical protein NGM10_05950 [Halorussus salilacus]|uniref:hypothetical protein n=1 Tax=Halorussus salilacus TaxID=2953750 RepID=UPI0020A1D81C|nr:hypothetical protein [Halorussus salilacus]USZ69277.1 hypothetical protein NGM10_05950 [Halorussus salilacus]
MTRENGDSAEPGSADATTGLLGDATAESLGDASMAVATAETRTEMASMALSDAREAAESVPDLDAVATRLDAYESRLASITDRRDELADDLGALVECERVSDAGDEAVTDRRRLAADAAAVHGAADELSTDLESFERWLTDPETRYSELEADIDAVEESLADLTATVEAVAAGRPAEGSDGDGDGVGAAWADARLRHRVVGLLLDDSRAELADLRTWADREDPGGDRLVELDDRLDDLDTRTSEVGDRLDDLARPEWEERFGGHLGAFEDETADLEPPLDWADVHAAFETHRPATDPGES